MERQKGSLVVYDKQPESIFFQYMPFLTQPNQLKTVDFCVSEIYDKEAKINLYIVVVRDLLSNSN